MVLIERRDYMEPATMSVKDLINELGVSLPVAYSLVKSRGFPTIRVGRRILIPRDEFKEWLKNNTIKEG